MGTADRRRREAAHRRKSIVEAARKIFWQRGYARATMPQIAEEAELAPGTLYLYFPSKDALYVELLIEGYDLLAERLEAAVGSGGEPLDQARALVDAFFDFAKRHPRYFDIMFFILQREAGSEWASNFPAEQTQRLQGRELTCRQVAARVLDRIGFGLPQRRAVAVNAIWGMLAGVVFYFRGDEAFDEIIEQAKQLMLAAVFGRE